MTILSEIKNRRSISFFQEKEKEKITGLIEAARWAPSSFNNQPWNYVFVFKKDKNRLDVENALAITNSWAKKAPLLIVVGGNPKDDTIHNDIEYYLYDIGLSAMSLVIEAEHQGLKTHQIGGWNKDKLKKAVGFSENIKPIVVIVVGYKEDKDKRGFFKKLGEKIKEKLIKQRQRKPVEEKFFFKGYKG